MRILLTGSSGQVGGDLLPALQRMGTVVAPTRSDLDLSNPMAVREFVAQVKPDWIVNPAAYTAVDKAETGPDAAYAINAEAPRALGLEAARLNIPVIHFSTDYVFNGSGEKPWTEVDATAPLGVYGASKLAGERALAESGAAHLIFRTSWVYNGTGKNFLLTILRLARQKQELRIVNDQFGAPTWSRDLARMVVQVIEQVKKREAPGGSAAEIVHALPDVYHAVARGETTWFGFAQEFVRYASESQPETTFARLIPIPGSEYPTPAQRPANSRLDCTRLKRIFHFAFPRWQDSTATVVKEVISRS